ncbi:hypothetical protein BaRGS_00004327, partial [Batillaria attramentaria]
HVSHVSRAVEYCQSLASRFVFSSLIGPRSQRERTIFAFQNGRAVERFFRLNRAQGAAQKRFTRLGMAGEMPSLVFSCTHQTEMAIILNVSKELELGLRLFCNIARRGLLRDSVMPAG